MWEAKVKEKEFFDEMWINPKTHTWSLPFWIKEFKKNGFTVSAALVCKWRKKDSHGVFDKEKFLSDNQERIFKVALKTAELGKPKAIDTFLTLMGELRKDKEVKVERTNSDITNDAERILEILRSRLTDGGICSVCKRPYSIPNKVL